ncbi:MAG: hypothetical protein RJA52_202, partial [Bacteroidota bacterium]
KVYRLDLLKIYVVMYNLIFVYPSKTLKKLFKESIWFFIIVLLSSSCKTNGHIPNSIDQGIPNESKEYFLYIFNEEDGRLTFYVKGKDFKEKILEKSITPGYVKWSGKFEIEYFDASSNSSVEKDIKKIKIKSFL